MKSETPRTDSILEQFHDPTGLRCSGSLLTHARQLERELNEAKARITSLEKEREELMERFSDDYP